MRVKVGDIWYDAHDVPIKIELSEGEREQVAQIDKPSANGRYGYAVLPLGSLNWTELQAYEWMTDQRLAYVENANRHLGKEEAGTIEVFVAGDLPAIGKSLVAGILARTLLQSGFSNVKYSCRDGDLSKFLLAPNQANRALTADLIKTVPEVVVHDNNQHPQDIPRSLHLTSIDDPTATPLGPDDVVEMSIQFADPTPPKSE